MPDGDFWSNRYLREGEIWLNKPSLTALFLSQSLPPGSKIFEIGFGYGRDLVYLAGQGFQVSGIERSEVGVKMARNQLMKQSSGFGQDLMQGDFLEAVLPSEIYDAVICHRVVHLLTEDGHVSTFENKVAQILKPQGMLLISARDPRGVKPERKGHNVEFWDEQRFQSVFGRDFEISEFIQGEEIESASNPVSTFFTMMVARRLCL